MSYVDKSIEEFVRKVREEYPNTYVLIWGDHTPGIEESEAYRQASYTEDNDYFEYVPLIVSTPDNKVYREESKVASFLDIAPTILNASGIDFEFKSDGINLVNPPGDAPEIPFKEKFYKRDGLYERITGEVSGG
jgi:phosphoglycerol transferase MdoB-like AlkP superfamily enzyme